jgi:hypothetical protein
MESFKQSLLCRATAMSLSALMALTDDDAVGARGES